MRAGLVVASPAWLLACLLSQGVGAQPPAGDRERVLIKDATVHVGDGRVLEHHDVLLFGSRIAKLGTSLEAQGGRVIEASGLHLAPGFIASDTVLGLVEVSAVRSTRDQTEVGRINPHVRAWAAVNPDSELLPVARANGVLHAMVAPHGGLVSGSGAVLRLAGWTREDMTLRGPAALFVNWPNMKIDRSKDAKPGVKEQEQKRDAALEELDDLASRARAYHASAATRERGSLPRGTRQPRLQAMAPYLSGEAPVVVRASTLAQMRSAIAWAKRQSLRLILAGARDAWRMADELAAAGVAVIVQPVRALPARDWEPYDAAFTNPVKLHAAGVLFSFNVGSGGFSAAHVRNLPDEAAMAIAYGLPPEAALSAITLNPARMFGVASDIGSIAPGKRAALVLWDGPPLEITSRVVLTFDGGKAEAVDDRHVRLYGKYQARPSLGR